VVYENGVLVMMVSVRRGFCCVASRTNVISSVRAHLDGAIHVDEDMRRSLCHDVLSIVELARSCGFKKKVR